MPIPFILASASPARRQLLQSAGIEPLIVPSDVDESQVTAADAATLVQTLAEQKAIATLNRLWANPALAPTELFGQPPGLILGCDSVLALNGQIYGKPADGDEAIARWQQMRGQVGELHTGHALIAPHTEAGQLQPQVLVRCQVTRVQFAQVNDREIAAYVATGEPLNCAGCFAIDGRGGLFVERLEGCHSNVIGLSLPLLRQMLLALGYDLMMVW